MSARPGVSVLVPFAGSRDDALAMNGAMGRLRLTGGDEGIVADNSPEGVLAAVELPRGWRTVPARREGSPAHTRNAAALAATREWLLFLDSDVAPPPDLLERFFERPIPPGTGVVGGRVLSDDSQRTIAARWADSRGMTAQESHMNHPFRPYFLSACLLVRREAFDQLGGFFEGIFNGEDVDFCWRAAGAGWELDLCQSAGVVHLHRESVGALLRQAAVRGASASWINRRWPTAARPRRPGLAHILKGIAATPVIALTGQIQRAQLRALDVATQVSERLGRLRPNRARDRGWAAGAPLEIWCDEFPDRADPSIAERARRLEESGHSVVVVARRRPERPALGVHDVRAYYLEDDTTWERLTAALMVLPRVIRTRRRPRGLLDVAPSVRRLRRERGVELLATPAATPAARAAAALSAAPLRGLGGP